VLQHIHSFVPIQNWQVCGKEQRRVWWSRGSWRDARLCVVFRASDVGCTSGGRSGA
jgi:hypothetical protein